MPRERVPGSAGGVVFAIDGHLFFSECGAAAPDLRIGEVADQPAQCLWSDLSYANSSNSAFASFRSRVSNPSVNQR